MASACSPRSSSADDLTLRSITAYRQDESHAPIDFDALPAVDVDVPGDLPQPADSRRNSRSSTTTARSTACSALYYLDANADTSSTCALPGGRLTASTFGDVDTETYAVFGDFTYDFTPTAQRLARRPLHLGPAHARRDPAPDLSRRRARPSSAAPASSSRDQSDFNGTADFKEFTPRASISFQPDDEQHDLRELFARLQGRRLRSARRLHRRAATSTATASATRSEIFDFMSFDPETVDQLRARLQAPICSTAGCASPRRLLRRLSATSRCRARSAR